MRKGGSAILLSYFLLLHLIQATRPVRRFALSIKDVVKQYSSHAASDDRIGIETSPCQFCFLMLGAFTKFAGTQLSHTNHLQNWYLSVHSLALSIIKIEQELDSSVSE